MTRFLSQTCTCFQRSRNCLIGLLILICLIALFHSVNPRYFCEDSFTETGNATLATKYTSGWIKKQLAISEAIWKRAVNQRHAWVSSMAKNDLNLINPWDSIRHVYFWDYFTPSFNCPHSVQRVGSFGDGGKWICGLELFNQSQNDHQQNNGNEETAKPPLCVVYSFGINNESSFEAELLERTNCHVFAYDFSVKSIGYPIDPKNPRVKFQAIGISGENKGNLFTLKSIMEQNGHDWIDILKIDVEGAEFLTLEGVMRDFEHFPFGQLLIEIHADGIPFPEFYKWWEKLEERGLRAFYSEVNHYFCAIKPRKPTLVEYSFVNIQGAHRLVQ